MSDKQARAGRYAQAIFQIMVDKWQADLKAVAAAVAGDARVSAVVEDGASDSAARVKAVEGVLPATLPDEVRNFVKLLAQEGDYALLPQVMASLSQTARGRTGPTRAEITSAVELTADEQSDIRKKLSEEYGDGLSFTFAVDPALMGGLRVRVGDTLIDTSVASRLAMLRESLNAAVR